MVEDSRRPGTLFGPFKDEYFARALVELIDDAFGLRACTNAEPYLRSPRFDLGACPGPCRGAISVADYATVGERVRTFLEGDEGWISARLRHAMERAGEDLRFEEAAVLRDRLDFCGRFCARQRFFRQFEHGTMVVGEPRFGLHYRFEAGVLLEVHNGGISVPVPPELREDTGDRRFLLDRAHLLYTWRSRHGEDAPG